MKVFEENYRLQSGGDVSSTFRNLEIIPKPRILLKAEDFGFLALFFASILLSTLLYMLHFQLQPLKGFSDLEGSLSAIFVLSTS